MHDWTLIGINYTWEKKECVMKFKNCSSKIVEFTAMDVKNIHIPHVEDWGESVSVNAVIGPIESNGALKLKIEMQSGDVISISAKSIDMGINPK